MWDKHHDFRGCFILPAPQASQRTPRRPPPPRHRPAVPQARRSTAPQASAPQASAPQATRKGWPYYRRLSSQRTWRAGKCEQATRKGWPYYRRDVQLAKPSSIVGPPLAGGLPPLYGVPGRFAYSRATPGGWPAPRWNGGPAPRWNGGLCGGATGAGGALAVAGRGRHDGWPAGQPGRRRLNQRRRSFRASCSTEISS